jgi:DNA mismatch repair protein MutL
VGRIRVLDERTANQIAAGEVVERPASVVKELVENSLDAGATEIRIQVARGGVEEIRVLDNGEGMDPEDMTLSLRRHATSKIARLEELSDLKTLGFRGEALPSIASVSRMTLESCPDDTGKGCRLTAEGGESLAPGSVGHPRGTTVTVRSLFFNAPARKKFLRAPGTESGHITETISRIALAHFDRRFFLEADGRTVLDAPPCATRGERVAQIFGRGVAEQLVRFDRAAGPYRASGHASRPDFTRSSPRDQWLFVNGRPVRDRGVLHAIAGAYHTLLPRGRYPFVLLFLEIPPDRVDVNVHPAKGEVRLADSGAIHELVRNAVRSALEGERPLGRMEGLAPVPSPASAVVLRQEERYHPRGEAAAGAGSASGEWEFPASGFTTSLFDSPGRGLGALVPLAQYRESYILASDSEGLVIVDQHVAHERVLYEEILRESGGGDVPHQALLFPLTLEMDPVRAGRLESGRAHLDRLGFQLEPFGPRSFLLREVPAILGSADLPALLRDLADDLEGEAGPESLDKLRDRLAATTACHAAVKVNFPLTPEKMSYLLLKLAQTDTPMTCPHGRPILLRLSQKDLEKGFHRR